MCFIIWIQFGYYNDEHQWGNKCMVCLIRLVGSKWWDSEVLSFILSWAQTWKQIHLLLFTWLCLFSRRLTKLARSLSSPFEQFIFPKWLESKKKNIEEDANFATLFAVKCTTVALSRPNGGIMWLKPFKNFERKKIGKGMYLILFL